MANEKETLTPEHAAQELVAGQIAAGAASSAQKVCLGPSNNGWFTLSWSATATGTYDWVGLYKNTTDPDGSYIGGNNWCWAEKAKSYVTSTSVQPGFEARYLIWDATSKSYKSVAKTGAYPGAVCSS